MDAQIDIQPVKTPRRTPEQLAYHRVKQRDYVARNRDAVNERQKEYSSSPTGRQRRKEYDRGRRCERLLMEARKRAKAKGLQITITVDDIVVPGICPVLGIPIAFDGNRENWPSLDRLDNSAGYVPGNVFVISYRANKIKNDSTLAEIEAIARYMRDGL